MIISMRAWNRAKLLWGYLARRAVLRALPVEYIVETTAKCNLYCPMCPRETHPQPKADMTDQVFERLVGEAGTSAEHMMLIGLGEPFMDPHIFERIEFCHRHSISTLLSTNGTFLDERNAARILDSPLEQMTLSFDGYKKETFEFFRKGARQFRPLRPHEARARFQAADCGADGEDGRQRFRSGRLHRFLERRAGCGPAPHQSRRDQPDAPRFGPRAGRLEASLPLPLARPHVRQAERRRLSVLPELYAGWRARGQDWGTTALGHLEFGADAGNAPSACRWPRRRSGHLFALLHHHSAPGTGDRQPAAAWPHGAASAAPGGAADVSLQAAEKAAAAVGSVVAGDR